MRSKDRVAAVAEALSASAGGSKLDKATLASILLGASGTAGDMTGPDGKPLDWGALTPEQQDAFNDMTNDEYRVFLTKQLEDTEGDSVWKMAQNFLAEPVNGLL